MSYTKITSDDTQNKGVVGLADTPGLSTTEMQQKFDELATDVIIPKFNNLVDELDASDIDKRIHSNDVTDIRLNVDDNIEVSTDGGTTYKQTASSGHIIMDGTGRSFTQRSRMQFSANAVISDVGADNTTFIQIPSGTKGDKGDSATIQVGTVTSSSTTPSVTNVGSQYDAIFDFALPKGDAGQSATIQVGTVTSGANASVSNRGTSSAAIFDFVLPKGDKGDNGTSFQVLGMYATYQDFITAHPTGNRGDAYAVGDATTNTIYNWNNDTQTWDNLGGLKGVKGDDGNAATVTVGTVTSGNTMSVVNSGTTTNAILDFVLEKGDKGDTGTSATIAVGTVAKGENASVVNSGTTTNAVFDFVIPKGDKGDAGAPSIVNGKSGDSIVLYGYDMYLKNYAKPSEYSEITDDDSIQSAIGKLEMRNSGGSTIRVTVPSELVGKTVTLTIDGNDYEKVADNDGVALFDGIKEIGLAEITCESLSRSLSYNCYSVYDVILDEDETSTLLEEKANQSDVYGSEEYNASTSYSVNDMCIYGGKLWKCLVACVGQTPSENTYWTRVSLASLTDGKKISVKKQLINYSSLNLYTWGNLYCGSTSIDISDILSKYSNSPNISVSISTIQGFSCFLTQNKIDGNNLIFEIARGTQFATYFQTYLIITAIG